MGFLKALVPGAGPGHSGIGIARSASRNRAVNGNYNFECVQKHAKRGWNLFSDALLDSMQKKATEMLLVEAVGIQVPEAALSIVAGKYGF